MTLEKFITGIVLASLVAMTIHDCQAAEWDNIDRALFTSHVALQVTDALQTNYVRQHQDQFAETNSLYGNPPNMGLVIGVKALLIGGSYWLVRDMSSYDRKLVLSVLNVIEVGIVARNASIGVRVGF